MRVSGGGESRHPYALFNLVGLLILREEGCVMERYRDCIVDELGRIVLPNTLRKDNDWKTGDNIAVYVVDENTVILHKSKKKQDLD